MPERDAMSESDGTLDSLPEVRASGALTEPSSQHQHPQRASALYQYHNAPEVAPAHGLEYDDSNYPHSDKYPVVHTTPRYDSKWTSKGYAHEGKPPRIIFGMKTKTFLIVAAIMTMVIVGAAVGGAVGGSSIKSSPAMPTTSSISTTTNTTSITTSAAPTATPSSYTAPIPTFGPVSDCPAANNTLYSSSFGNGQSGTVPPNAQLNFTRYCDVSNPITSTNTQLSTYVYSFEDCIEACASLNFYNGNGICQVAAFKLGGSRPANCWVGTTTWTYKDLTNATDIDVAFLRMR